MTRTITMLKHVRQDGSNLGDLENINHVIRSLLGPVTIDWRDPYTVEISLEDK